MMIGFQLLMRTVDFLSVIPVIFEHNRVIQEMAKNKQTNTTNKQTQQKTQQTNDNIL